MVFKNLIVLFSYSCKVAGKLANTFRDGAQELTLLASGNVGLYHFSTFYVSQVPRVSIKQLKVNRDSHMFSLISFKKNAAFAITGDYLANDATPSQICVAAEFQVAFIWSLTVLFDIYLNLLCFYLFSYLPV